MLFKFSLIMTEQSHKMITMDPSTVFDRHQAWLGGKHGYKYSKCMRFWPTLKEQLQNTPPQLTTIVSPMRHLLKERDLIQ